MNNVLKNFIIPMRLRFDDPHSDEQRNKSFFLDLKKAMSGFSDDTLQQCVVKMINTWQSRRFPSVGACVTACDDIAGKKMGQTTPFPVIHEKTEEWAAWQDYFSNTGQHGKIRLMAMQLSWTVPSLWPPGHNNIIPIDRGAQDGL